MFIKPETYFLLLKFEFLLRLVDMLRCLSGFDPPSTLSPQMELCPVCRKEKSVTKTSNLFVYKWIKNRDTLKVSSNTVFITDCLCAMLRQAP